MSAKSYLLGIAVIMLLAGCGGDNNGNGNGPVETSQPYFPNKVNTVWTYEVYDHIANHYDTITVEIKGTTTLTGIPRTASIWTFTPCGRSEDIGLCNFFDTLYVVAPDYTIDNASYDSVMIYSSSNPVTPFMKIMLPFTVSDCWSCPQCRDLIDSTCCEQEGTVTLDDGVYQNAFRLYELYDRGENWLTGVYSPWFKPGVGMVKAVRAEYDAVQHPGNPIREAEWRLIESYIEQ